jgi:hypothetical protein
VDYIDTELKARKNVALIGEYFQDPREYASARELLAKRLMDFVLSIDRGFVLAALKKRIPTPKGTHRYVDVVFYNRNLRCYILINLKTSLIIPHDVDRIAYCALWYDIHEKSMRDTSSVGVAVSVGKEKTILEMASEDEEVVAKVSMLLPSADEMNFLFRREMKE